MTQNIYDDPAFFARYGALPRSREGLGGAPEWHSLAAMLPPLRGLRVLDLGCGFGWFCRFAHDAGAASVVGMDVSESMLARARAGSPGDAATYLRADLEHADLPEASFDLAYSSLAFHYVADFGGLVAAIHRALAPGGTLVFSIEHPIYMAVRRASWLTDADGARIWPVQDYSLEGARRKLWLGAEVDKQHRTIATTLNTLIDAGFTLRHVDEWAPTDEQVAGNPALAEERDRPMFLLVRADR